MKDCFKWTSNVPCDMALIWCENYIRNDVLHFYSLWTCLDNWPSKTGSLILDLRCIVMVHQKHVLRLKTDLEKMKKSENQ